MKRRDFIRNTGLVTGTTVAGNFLNLTAAQNHESVSSIRISKVISDFEREPLVRSFGFKGNYMSEIWQTISYLESSSGIHQIGLGTQSVLWSDARVFADHSESGGNALMYALTERALQIMKGQSFSTPIDLLDNILPEVYAYGQKITSNPDLRKTFALNALVGTDNAAWLLYARENGFSTFDEMIPKAYLPALSNHHKEAAAIPLMAYNIPISEIQAATEPAERFPRTGKPGTDRKQRTPEL